MASLRKSLSKILRRQANVQEAASYTRALAFLLGQAPKDGLASAIEVSQALLTDRIVRIYGEQPWPASISREQDPEDPAFLPPLAAHLPLSARDAVLLGIPGHSRLALVDPWGWAGAVDSPMTTIWFGSEQKMYQIGKLPSEKGMPPILQRRSDDGHGIQTEVRRDDISLQLFHWPIVIDGDVAWAMVARVSASKAQRLKLAISIQPMDFNGSHPLFSLRRDQEGNWFANGSSILSVARPGQAVFSSIYGEESLWRRIQSGMRGLSNVQDFSITCPAGQCSAAEVFEADLEAEQQLSCFAILSARKPLSSQLVRINQHSLWNGAIADKKGLMKAGAHLDVGDLQWLFDAARYRLLIDDTALNLSGCLSCVALARLGFTQQAGQRLGRFFKDDIDEAPELLAWAATEFLLWTGERSWLQAHGRELVRLLDRLAEGNIKPSGTELFGPEGSLRWSEIWRVAALLNAVRVLRDKEEQRHRWGLAGSEGLEGLLEFLGPSPWSSAPNRAPSGASAAMLAASWIGLISFDSKEVLQTLEFLKQHQHDGGVFLHGGTHIGATSIQLAIKQKLDPSLNGPAQLARYAASTGALPTARHRERGALCSGDDVLSAALFVLLLLEQVRFYPEEIRIGPAIQQCINLPTPYGKIDFSRTKHGVSVFGRWKKGARKIRSWDSEDV